MANGGPISVGSVATTAAGAFGNLAAAANFIGPQTVAAQAAAAGVGGTLNTALAINPLTSILALAALPSLLGQQGKAISAPLGEAPAKADLRQVTRIVENRAQATGAPRTGGAGSIVFFDDGTSQEIDAVFRDIRQQTGGLTDFSSVFFDPKTENIIIDTSLNPTRTDVGVIGINRTISDQRVEGATVPKGVRGFASGIASFQGGFAGEGEVEGETPVDTGGETTGGEAVDVGALEKNIAANKFAPQISDIAVQRAQLRERRRRIRRAAVNSTLVTGGAGVTTPPSLASNRLIGG